MSEDDLSFEVRYRRLIFNRKLLVFFHVMVALTSSFLYLSQVNLTRFNYTRSRSSIFVVLLAAPAILPYLISGVYAVKCVTYRRARTLAYLLVLIAGAVWMNLALYGNWLAGWSWAQMAIVQTLIYVWAAELLLNVV